jgi:hypothetical protein
LGLVASREELEMLGAKLILRRLELLLKTTIMTKGVIHLQASLIIVEASNFSRTW